VDPTTDQDVALWKGVMSSHAGVAVTAVSTAAQGLLDSGDPGADKADLDTIANIAELLDQAAEISNPIGGPGTISSASSTNYFREIGWGHADTTVVTYGNFTGWSTCIRGVTCQVLIVGLPDSHHHRKSWGTPTSSAAGGTYGQRVDSKVADVAVKLTGVIQGESAYSKHLAKRGSRVVQWKTGPWMTVH
jgi:hypothetical protein